MNKNYERIDKKAPGATHYVGYGRTGTVWHIKKVKDGYVASCAKAPTGPGLFYAYTLDEVNKELGRH